MDERNPNDGDSSDELDASGSGGERDVGDTGDRPNAGDTGDEPDAGFRSDADVSADWMAPVDGDIVELMRSEDVFSPDHIADKDVCRAPDAAYRCRELAKYGLLKKHTMGMYDITDLGERYLDGEVDPSDLEPES